MQVLPVSLYISSNRLRTTHLHHNQHHTTAHTLKNQPQAPTPHILHLLYKTYSKVWSSLVPRHPITTKSLGTWLTQLSNYPSSFLYNPPPSATLSTTKQNTQFILHKHYYKSLNFSLSSNCLLNNHLLSLRTSSTTVVVEAALLHHLSRL